MSASYSPVVKQPFKQLTIPKRLLEVWLISHVQPSIKSGNHLEEDIISLRFESAQIYGVSDLKHIVEKK